MWFKRILGDVRDVYSDLTLDGIFVGIDDDALNIVHAVIVGPKDTPYEGGFFYFRIHFLDDYPVKPPIVKLMTTGGGKVTFNPNLYKNGHVCLSILGTWPGPGWSAVMTLRSVLLSLQSLLCEEPYFNEPGRERFRNFKFIIARKSKAYNKKIRYLTLKSAILSIITDRDTVKMPELLRNLAKQYFLDNYLSYAAIADVNIRDKLISSKNLNDYKMLVLQQATLVHKLKTTGNNSMETYSSIKEHYINKKSFKVKVMAYKAPDPEDVADEVI